MSDSNDITKDEAKVEVMKDEERLLMDHNYDGIHELDHVLPRWWLGIFYITIFFAACYVAYYLPGYGQSSRQELASAMSEIEKMKASQELKSGAGSGAESEAKLFAASKDPVKLKHGAEVYQSKCLACHGDKGQGVIGPNLTDEYWINGKGSLKDLAQLVSVGVAEKGMPPWGPILTADELIDVVAFTYSLYGSAPAGAKAAQGTKQELRD